MKPLNIFLFFIIQAPLLFGIQLDDIEYAIKVKGKAKINRSQKSSHSRKHAKKLWLWTVFLQINLRESRQDVLDTRDVSQSHFRIQWYDQEKKNLENEFDSHFSSKCNATYGNSSECGCQSAQVSFFTEATMVGVFTSCFFLWFNFLFKKIGSTVDKKSEDFRVTSCRMSGIQSLLQSTVMSNGLVNLFVGFPVGLHKTFPARSFASIADVNGCRVPGTCSDFDPRYRPWFAHLFLHWFWITNHFSKVHCINKWS